MQHVSVRSIKPYAYLFIFICALSVYAANASAQGVDLGPTAITGVAGVSFSTMAIGIRFFGALWASIGIAYFIWGLTDYMLSHDNAHHKAEGQATISKGFTILVGFTIAWIIVKTASHFIFG